VHLNGLFLGLAIFCNKALTLSLFLASLYVCFVYQVAKGRDHEIIVRALDLPEGPYHGRVKLNFVRSQAFNCSVKTYSTGASQPNANSYPSYSYGSFHTIELVSSF
jgi:hypothetical protein